MSATQDSPVSVPQYWMLQAPIAIIDLLHGCLRFELRTHLLKQPSP